MKNYKGIILLLAGVVTLITACKKYETFPVDQLNIDRVFDSRDSLGTNAYQYLNSVYAIMKNGHNRIDGTDYLDAASDDAVSSAASGTNTVTELSTGSYNSGTFADAISSSNDNLWANYYAGIRQANIFITNIDVVPVEGSFNGVPLHTVWQSEARFLRAYFYFELVKRYGGVPLLGDKVLNINDDVKLPRNSFADCMSYIVSECDAIKDKLYTEPLPTAGLYGRVTQGAALALKARALLYAASPLFNGGNIDPANPLTGYTGAATADRWKAAADAAKDVMNLNFYALDTAGGTASGLGFKDVFITQNTKEIIFIRQGDDGTNIEAKNAPVGLTAGVATGNESPTQDLVNAFPMKDGKAIGTSATYAYNDQNPYINRDPRLTHTVFYNGGAGEDAAATWLNTSLQMYEGGQSKPNLGNKQTLTGYYMRKFMGNSETTNSFTKHSEDWVIFRYAEILLDYAEAQNEFAGPSDDIYAALRAIRQRAGILPGTDGNYGLDVTADKDGLRSIIQNERRIEFAFEEQRFFDIRRWKIASIVMSQPRNGVIITGTPPASLNYNYGPVHPEIFSVRPFETNDKRYLYPIPYDEVRKNPQMKQNIGW